MIDWTSTQITDPPAIYTLTDEDIGHFIYEKRVISGKDYTYHTQAEERMWTSVTENSSQACSQLTREGIIVSTLMRRKRIPAFKSKKDFVPTK